MGILDSFKAIMQCAAFCKSPVGNTFTINNSDKCCIIKYLGNEVVFNY